MRNKKNIIIVSMIAAVLVLVVGFAALQTQLTITGAGNITTTWRIEITNITSSATGEASNLETPSFSGTNATLSTKLRKPGDKMEYTITVKNTGTVDAIIQEVNAEVSGSNVIVYSIDGIQNQTRLASNQSLSFKLIVEFASEATYIPTNATKEINITINTIQDDGQTLTPSTPGIEGEYEKGSLTNIILLNNQAYADNVTSPKVTNSTGINFGMVYSQTNGNGLYYTSTNTEDNKTTYYFRGEVYNNYVSFGTMEGGYCTYNGNKLYDYYTHAPITSEDRCYFHSLVCDATNSSMSEFKGKYYAAEVGEQCESYMGGTSIYESLEWEEATIDMLWRIVRINEDGSIRLILNQNVESGVAFNSNDGVDNAYIGYMYGEVGSLNYADAHTNTTDSTIKTKLDNWYNTALTANEKTYVADSGFCNDRTLYSGLGYGANYTEYAAYNRLSILHKPQFACPNEERDLFTLKGSSKGNKALTNPVGLLTADEVVYAGLITEGELYGDIFSIYLNDSRAFWTMTPQGTRDDDGSDYIYLVNSHAVNGSTGLYSYPSYVAETHSSHTLRPVINLKANVQYQSGNGTYDSPYMIKSN